MSYPPLHDDEDDNEPSFIDEADIIHEVEMDNEDLPDADDDSELEDEDGDFVHKFTAHTGELYSVASSPNDAALVATGGGDDRGFLWKIGQGDWAFELQGICMTPGHEESVSSLAFSYDGQRLASGSLDGIIKVWDVSGNLEGKKLEGPGGGIEWLSWHPRGHILLAGSEDFTIWTWNTDNAALLNTFIGHGDSVVDNNALAPHSDSIECVGFSPRLLIFYLYVQSRMCTTEILMDGETAYSRGKGVGMPWDGSYRHNNYLFALHLGSMDKKMIIWDIEHLIPRATCEHEDGVTCLTWLGASYVATGCVDGKVRLWDSRSGECVKTLKGHSDAIQSLSVSANRDYLVSASLDGTACAFEVENFRIEVLDHQSKSLYLMSLAWRNEVMVTMQRMMKADKEMENLKASLISQMEGNVPRN
ncbi:hypothetical protein V8G54_030407 [Vigna mungo]|uniref:Angio-associated migratory cell protein n=1 Tax=Vigna mungo TaxID=3915 RepID=A0AAQ3MWB5_VIGMU